MKVEGIFIIITKGVIKTNKNPFGHLLDKEHNILKNHRMVANNWLNKENSNPNNTIVSELLYGKRYSIKYTNT